MKIRAAAREAVRASKSEKRFCKLRFTLTTGWRMPRKVCKIGESESRYSRGSRGSWLCTSAPFPTMRKMRFGLILFAFKFWGARASPPRHYGSPFLLLTMHYALWHFIPLGGFGVYLLFHFALFLFESWGRKELRYSMNKVFKRLCVTLYPSCASEIHENRLFRASPWPERSYYFSSSRKKEKEK